VIAGGDVVDAASRHRQVGRVGQRITAVGSDGIAAATTRRRRYD
jgi:hypothetical protein